MSLQDAPALFFVRRRHSLVLHPTHSRYGRPTDVEVKQPDLDTDTWTKLADPIHEASAAVYVLLTAI